MAKNFDTTPDPLAFHADHEDQTIHTRINQPAKAPASGQLLPIERAQDALIAIPIRPDSPAARLNAPIINEHFALQTTEEGTMAGGSPSFAQLIGDYSRAVAAYAVVPVVGYVSEPQLQVVRAANRHLRDVRARLENLDSAHRNSQTWQMYQQHTLMHIRLTDAHHEYHQAVYQLSKFYQATLHSGGTVTDDDVERWSLAEQLLNVALDDLEHIQACHRNDWWCSLRQATTRLLDEMNRHRVVESLVCERVPMYL